MKKEIEMIKATIEDIRESLDALEATVVALEALEKRRVKEEPKVPIAFVVEENPEDELTEMLVKECPERFLSEDEIREANVRAGAQRITKRVHRGYKR